jgi:hypothetical protein
VRAKIDGDLFLDGTSVIVGIDKSALVGDRLIVEHAMFLRNGFRSEGGVRLLGARIGGQLVCDGAHMAAEPEALNLDSASIGGALLLRDLKLKDGETIPFFAKGEIRLTGTRIGGPVECGGTICAEFEGSGSSTAEVVALRLNGYIVETDVNLRESLKVKGEVRATGVRINRNFT